MRPRQAWMPITALTLAMMLVFVVDVVLAAPVAVVAFYLPVLLYATRFESARLTWWLLGASTALILLPLAIEPTAHNESTLFSVCYRLAIIITGLTICWFNTQLRTSADSAVEDADASRRAEREFRTLAENLPDIVTRFDRDLRHLYVNRRILHYTGSPPESYLGKDHAELGASGELVELWQQKIREVLDSGEPLSFEYTYVALQGPRHFECRLVPELGPVGGVQSVLGINRDVTEMIRAQEQSRAHLEQLAHVSRLSTIGSLVSEIAHEINQPLHAITNYTQATLNMLEAAEFDRKSTVLGYVRQVADQSNRAAEIIRRSSRFARKSPLRRSTVDVNQLIRDCLRLENFDLRTNRIRLRCDLAQSMPPVVVDSLQVQQVLVNLLRNAVEAMNEIPEGDRRLVVRSEHVDDNIQISIRDFGAGVTAEQVEKLFEPFFTTKREGMGMGLAVSQAIVEAHSGRLWVEPNPDRGVTFFFTLPVSREEISHEYCHV